MKDKVKELEKERYVNDYIMSSVSNFVYVMKYIENKKKGDK